MIAKLNWLFALGILAFFVWTLVEAQGFRAQARLFPVVISVAGLALTGIYVATELVRVRRAGGLALASAPHESADLDDEHGGATISPDERRRRTAAILGWIVGFTLTIWLLGFPLAVPLATGAYLRFGVRESWRVSVAFGLAAGVIFYVVFVLVVRIPFEPGLLPALLPE